MTASVGVPLRAAQVQAGIAIYDSVEWFKTVDGVLADLKAEKPGFNARSTLLKTAAINTLYAAGLRDVHRATDHIVGVMSRPIAMDDVQLVQDLAAIPKKTGNPGDYLVFASKFGHFFVRGSVPIFDSFSKVRVSHHLGLGWNEQTPVTYAAYFEKIATLRASAGVAASARDFDKYLWVAGEYAAHKANRPGLNSDLVKVFTDRPASLVPYLDVLL